MIVRIDDAMIRCIRHEVHLTSRRRAEGEKDAAVQAITGQWCSCRQVRLALAVIGNITVIAHAIVSNGLAMYSFDLPSSKNLHVSDAELFCLCSPRSIPAGLRASTARKYRSRHNTLQTMAYATQVRQPELGGDQQSQPLD